MVRDYNLETMDNTLLSVLSMMKLTSVDERSASRACGARSATYGFEQ